MELVGSQSCLCSNTHGYEQEIVWGEVQSKIIPNHRPLNVFVEKYIKDIQKCISWLLMKLLISNFLCTSEEGWIHTFLIQLYTCLQVVYIIKCSTKNETKYSLKIKLSLRVHRNCGSYSGCLDGTASSSKITFKSLFFLLV